LGNGRPTVLIKLENSVLKAIIDIAQGKATEAVVDALYYQIESLHKDLLNDEKAVEWFHLSNAPLLSAPLTPAVTALPSTSLAGQSFQFQFFVYLMSRPQGLSHPPNPVPTRLPFLLSHRFPH
jgi:hypothetical protein